jgi:hypothetical protein
VHGEKVKLPQNFTDLAESTALDLRYQQSDFEDVHEGEDTVEVDLESTYQIPEILT